MRTTKIILTLLLFTLLAQASIDRSIYRKKHSNEKKVSIIKSLIAYDK